MGKACLHFHPLIAMTTTTKTAVVKTTKTTITKAELKKIKAAKKTAGKIAKSASAKKNALATKKIWVYIKSHKLNEGRIIKPDSALKAVFPVASLDMLKMAGFVSKHLS